MKTPKWPADERNTKWRLITTTIADWTAATKETRIIQFFGLAPASSSPCFGREILNPLLRRLATLLCQIKTLNPSWINFDAILSTLGQLVKSVMPLYLHKEVLQIVLPLSQWKEGLLPSQRMLAF